MGKEKHKREKQHPQANIQKESHNAPTLNGVIDPETQAKAGAEGTQDSAKKEKRPMRLRDAIERSSVSDWLLVLFTAVLAAVAIYQYFAMGDQLDAMKESNKINREGLESVQRAFVGFINFDQMGTIEGPPGDVQRILTIRAVWENSGATRAIVRSEYFRVQAMPQEPGDEEFSGKGLENITFSSGVIAPKQPHFSGEVRTPAEDILGKDGQWSAKPPFSGHLYYWGWIVYRDAFPNTKEHVSEFCQVLIRVGQNVGGPPDSHHFTWKSCSGRHNCADEQCKDYESILAKAPTP